MTELKRIEIEQEDLNYMQRLTYEVDSRQRIIATLIENHAVDESDAVLTSPAFRAYHEQLDKATAAFEIAKIRLAEKYLPEQYKNDRTARWEVDFACGEMVIRR